MKKVNLVDILVNLSKKHAIFKIRKENTKNIAEDD